MSDVQDYNSSLSDAAQSRRFETFSYLPQLSKESIRAQIQYIVDKGWNPGIEHTEPENAFGYYWYMWKLPMFGATDLNAVIDELDACRRSYPDHHVRLIGYDNYSQSQGVCFVVYEGR